MPTTDLILSVQPDTDVLHRVLSVCHRRRLVVTTLTYDADRLQLRVDGDITQSNRLSVWLAALPDVLNVVEITARGGRVCA
jgi:acetolactate synthase regulatory subunit